MKFLKYILFFLFSLLLNRSVSATEIAVVENQNVFFEISHNQTISKENTWLGLLYLQENNKLATSNVKTALSCKQNFSSVNPNSIDAWERLVNAPSLLRKNVDLLENVADWPTSWNLNTVGNTVEVVQNSGRKIATITDGRIIAPARTLTGTAGNPLLNRVPLVKNVIYEVDGIEYITDNLGRVTKTTADLDDVVRVRLGNQQIRAVDIKDGVNGVDQGGHIVASRFFGPGEQINLYPQSANLNQGAWKQMENSWAADMVAGKDVKIEVEAIFSGTSQRPDAFEVSYWIDGVKTERTFINQ